MGRGSAVLLHLWGNADRARPPWHRLALDLLPTPAPGAGPHGSSVWLPRVLAVVVCLLVLRGRRLVLMVWLWLWLLFLCVGLWLLLVMAPR